METLWTAEDLSQIFKCSRVWIYKLVREQRIPFYHLEKSVRFDPGEIREWMEQRKCRALQMPRKLKRPLDDQSSDKK